MRDQTGAPVSAPAAGDADSGALFIVTLTSSTTPMALEVPSMAELAGLAVFRSRKVEDGRDRFRLHLGYFESVGAAQAVLPAVRQHFPAAWIGPAPQSGMGSLDDTSVAQFKFIKAPSILKTDAGTTSTRLRALGAAPIAPVATKPAARPAERAAPASTPKGRASASTAANASRKRANAPASPAKANVPAAAKAPAATIARSAPPAKVAANGRAGTPSATPPVAPAIPASSSVSKGLAPGEVLSLLESGPVKSPPSRSEQMAPRERAAVIGAIQRFAVQLVWSTEPVNLTEVPKLSIFDAYTLYKVQVDRAGRRWYGLRLGFFGDPVSARQVALYARSDFSAAAVVPVSDRECDRAAQAAVKELPDPPPAPKPELEVELIDLPRTSQPAAPGPALVKLAKGGKPAQAKSSEPKAAEARPEKTRRLKSTAEMAEELAAEPSFEMDGDVDPLNDTGVRHLAVTVVKKDSGLGKLFKRRR